MRRLPVLGLLLLLLFGASSANAATITSLVQFDGTLGFQTFTEPGIPLWTHNLSFVPAAASITSATLELRHSGNNNLPFIGTEAWSLSSQSNVSIGSLGSSLILNTDTFSIPASLFPSFPASSWALALKLVESTGGNDSISLDFALLTVTFNPVQSTPPVPEPATLTLVGTGVAAALWRRRRQKRQNAQ